VLNHPPYSPDLSPCDYFLFPKLKLPLKGRLFEDVQNIQGAVTRNSIDFDIVVYPFYHCTNTKDGLVAAN